MLVFCAARGREHLHKKKYALKFSSGFTRHADLLAIDGRNLLPRFDTAREG